MSPSGVPFFAYMMQSALTQFATTLGLVFFYGERSSFNSNVDKISKELAILYHQDYVQSATAIDMQGAIDDTYNMILYILLPTEKVAKVDTSLENIRIAYGLRNQLIDILSHDYELSGMSTRDEPSYPSNRYLSGVRFVVSAKSKVPVSIC